MYISYAHINVYHMIVILKELQLLSASNLTNDKTGAL